MTRKPVIVRKLTRDWYGGYAPATISDESADLELLDSAGKLIRVPWTETKWVCYIRDPAGESSSAASSSGLGLGPDSGPERLLRRRFSSRPRMAGLWLRLNLADGDELEGLAANDVSLIRGAGLMLTPPDTRSATQRIFVPRTSIRDCTLLAVIAPPASGKHTGVAAGQEPAGLTQSMLFDQPGSTDDL